MQIKSGRLYISEKSFGDAMSQTIIRDYLRTAIGEDPAGPADTELLARFAQTRDQGAFELIVWRHAAMVQRVCRGILANHHDAEDAAQAAFLILARKAHSFSGCRSVVGWLFGVSRQVSVRLSRERKRQPAASANLDHIPAVKSEPLAQDEADALTAEVSRLPERYRIPVLLCFFEGLTHAEAAVRTGWAIGTVAGRLARAKNLLARRLGRNGMGVAGVSLGLPAGLFVTSTARAAVGFTVRGAALPSINPSVLHLAEGVLSAMTATKLKLAATALVLCLAGTAGWGLVPGTRPPTAKGRVVEEKGRLAPETSPLKPSDRAATSAEVARDIDNMKNIMLAMHAYHDVNNFLPRDITDANGKPLLSWRVAILPYLEQMNLYQQFNLKEPWDSETNKKLLARMPEVYRSSFQEKGGSKTLYQVFAGPDTPFEPGKRLTFLDIFDGTSITFGVVQAGPAVEWTKPADLPYDPKKPIPKLELPYKNVFLAACLDGAIHTLRPDLKAEILRHLIEKGDGTNVPFDDIEIKLPAPKEPMPAQPTVGELLKIAQERLDSEVRRVKAQAREMKLQKAQLEELAKENAELQKQLEAAKKELEAAKKELEAARKK